MFRTFQATLNSSSATLIYHAEAETEVRIRHGSGGNVFIGDSNVRANNGWLLYFNADQPQEGHLDVILSPGDEIWGIASVAVSVNVLVVSISE